MEWGFPLVGWIGSFLLGVGIGMGGMRLLNFMRRQTRRDDRS